MAWIGKISAILMWMWPRAWRKLSFWVHTGSVCRVWHGLVGTWSAYALTSLDPPIALWTMHFLMQPLLAGHHYKYVLLGLICPYHCYHPMDLMTFHISIQCHGPRIYLTLAQEKLLCITSKVDYGKKKN